MNEILQDAHDLGWLLLALLGVAVLLLICGLEELYLKAKAKSETLTPCQTFKRLTKEKGEHHD